MSPEEKSAWDEMTAQLDYHNKPGHGWLETLNRLWRKNRFVTSLDGMLKLEQAPPVLTRDMLTVSREQWPLERLAPLLHPDAHGRARPKRDERPILLLEWQGRHYLIDGTNRVNRRLREKLAGPHDVLVIHGRQA